MTMMHPRSQTKVIPFDLDNTLFDHHYSLRSAISAIQRKYPSLSGFDIQILIDTYNTTLQQAYNEYLDKKISYEEADVREIRLFFTELGLPEPSTEGIKGFRDIYKPVYRENRRATPGSIETLSRLRELGYQIAIISNGQIQDQEAKADAIGVRHLVDRVITSEGTGCCKPDPQIFHFALEALGAVPEAAHMVGDSPDSDIKGAINAKISAVMYSPLARNSRRLMFGKEIPIIHHMSQLLGHLGIS